MALRSRIRHSKKTSRNPSNKRKAQKRASVSPSTAIVPVAAIRKEYNLKAEQIDLIRSTICRNATNEELRLFLWVAKRHKLDPLTRQLHAIKRFVTKHHQDEKGIWVGGDQMTIQIGIDGYRSMAARYKDYGAVDEPEYEFEKPGDKIPVMARVRLWKKGLEHPTVGIAFWDEYAPADLSADKAFMWKKMPKLMLAKCAEALALRKGYPDLADIYTDEEMHQADIDYTPGGRQIVTEDGTSPSGRPVTWEAREAAKLAEVVPDVPRTGSLAAAQEVLKSKLGAAKSSGGAKSDAGESSTAPIPPAVKPEPWKFAGTVTIDHTKQPPIVTGDMEELVVALPKDMNLAWGQDEFYHVALADLDKLRAACVRINFEIREIRPAKAPPTKQRHDVSEAATKRESGSGGQSTAAPVAVSGFIEQANPESGKTPRMAVLFKIGKTKYWMTAWSDKLFPWLIKGKEKNLPCELIVTKREKDGKTYTNIVGLKTVGGQEFDDDMKTPIIQNKDREAGGRTLF
jgi:phage recombination protein Bet